MVKVDSLRSFLPLLGASLAACGGGAAASGGAAPPSAKPADSATSATASKACPDAVIDDAEDNDGKTIVQKDRGGYWFTYADEAGSTISPTAKKFEMAAGGANGSKFAAHMSGKMGKADSVWAGMGFGFTDPKKPYNASAYKGVSFQAKIGAGSAAKVYVGLSDVNTDPDGKVCNKDKGCWNHFGSEITLTDKWAKYTMPFSGMTQQAGWGEPRPPSIDASKIFGMQWAESAASTSFDVWVDDVQFVCE